VGRPLAGDDHQPAAQHQGTARHGYRLRRLMLPAFGDTALADMAGRDAAIAAALDELIEAASTLARERRGVEATCDACLSLAGELGRRRGRW
jgi:hypothetical protein